MNADINILANIKVLLKKQNKTQADLADYLGIHKNNVTEWLHGRSSSYRKYLPQIAAFFGISVDELIGNSILQNDLTENEKTILTIYRQLSEEGRMRVVQAVMNIRDAEAQKNVAASHAG